MTLVADRFIRFDDGVVRDLATGEEVTLIELTLTGVAEQVARRDYCLARLDAQARGRPRGDRRGGDDAHVGLAPSREGSALEDFALVDFGLVGESQWVEAYRKTSEVAMPRECEDVRLPEVLARSALSRDGTPWSRGESWYSRDAAGPSRGAAPVIVGPVVDAITATLDGLGSRDVRRLYVKAPEGARLGAFEAIIAREVRARGFIPLSAAMLGASPAIARVIASRSIVLFGDARCVFNDVSFSSFGVRGAVARAIALLHGAASAIVALVAHVCDHVNVAALRLMPANSTARPAFGWRRAAVIGVVSDSSANFSSDFASGSGPPPESVVQPAAKIFYDDPNLPSLFPSSERIAQVAEAAPLASFEPDGDDEASGEVAEIGEVGELRMVPWSTIAHVAPERANGAGADSPTFEDAAGFEEPRGPEASPDLAAPTGVEDVTRYPPLRLVKRRTTPESAEPGMERTPEEPAAVDIPVVTTMVSGYGDAVDVLIGRGRWAAASRVLRAELAGYERRKRPHDAARTSIALGRLHLAMGEAGPAARCFDRAGELASACIGKAAFGSGFDSDRDSARLIGEALRWSGVAALDDADLERSERLLRSALAAIGPEADPHQAFAIELSLARCLFWQGRGREVVLPSPHAVLLRANGGRELVVEGVRSDCEKASQSVLAPTVGGCRAFAESAGVERDALAAVILRVEHCRRAARIALADGDLSTAGNAIARACRIARGEDDDARGDGCRFESSERRTRSARPDAASTNDTRRQRQRLEELRQDAREGLLRRPHPGRSPDRCIRDALRAACHLDAARLQFAIGDTASGDAHLRECFTLSRAPARAARMQLLQLARFRNVRTIEGRRRFERLSSALRQPRMPRLVRIQARYLIDPRSRRALELVTFLDRHGDTALAGYGHPARHGGSPMLEAFQDVLRICHESPDDLTALTRVSAWLRDQLRALSVAVYGAAPSGTDVAVRAPRMPGRAHALTQAHSAAEESQARGRATEEPPTSADLGSDGGERAHSVRSKVASDDGDPDSVASRGPEVIEGALDARHSADDERVNQATSTVVVRFAVAGSTRILSPGLAERAIDSGLAIPPTYRPDALDAAAPVRYGDATIGAIVVRWSIDATFDHIHASALIGAAAAVVSPHLRAVLDREPHDAALAGAATGHGRDRERGPGPGLGTGSSTGVRSRSQARTPGLLGISAAMDTLRHTITRVSSAPFHVLIEGESGSGKELVARALHQHGPRRHRRFCAVNCAAFTDELLEAELFGHTRGAFTGALAERAGLFEEADGGTLFLDEIGELSPRGQAKLLRVIQDGETRRIGENMPRRVDTRIIAATNRSLRDEADAGQFRADLLYRLDVIRITVPPLRARLEDVAVLARAFWEEATARLGSRATLDPATLTALARYHWPGNVRELHNAIMALAVHAPPRGRVTPSQLPEAIGARATSGTAHHDAVPRVDGDGDSAAIAGANVGARDSPGDSALRVHAGGVGDPNDRSSSDASDVAQAGWSEPEPVPFEGRLEDAKRAFESRYIRAALARAGGSPSRAASALGLTRQGLAKLMARLELDDAVERRARPRRPTARKERSPP